MQGVLMLSRATVRDADFRRVSFDQFAPEGCTFERYDFRKADLVGVVFAHGIDIKRQKWPEGPQYVILDRIHQRIAKVRIGVLEWRDHQARQEALDMLQAASLLYAHQMTIIGRRGQQHWLGAA